MDDDNRPRLDIKELQNYHIRKQSVKEKTFNEILQTCYNKINKMIIYNFIIKITIKLFSLN